MTLDKSLPISELLPAIVSIAVLISTLIGSVNLAATVFGMMAYLCPCSLLQLQGTTRSLGPWGPTKWKQIPSVTALKVSKRKFDDEISHTLTGEGQFPKLYSLSDKFGYFLLPVRLFFRCHYSSVCKKKQRRLSSSAKVTSYCWAH